jgi:hypothetical protein
MLIGDEVCALGLARHHGVPEAPVEVLRDRAALSAVRSVLVVATGCKSALEQGSFENWRETLLLLDRQVIKPALDALRAGAVRHLVLRADGDCFNVSRAGLLRFWRRARPFGATLAAGST